MQDVRDSRRKKTKNTPPTHPRNTGKPPGKRGKGTQPTQKKQNATETEGRRKTQQGEPHPPREKEKNATRPRKKIDKITWGEPRLEEGGQRDVEPLLRELELAESLCGGPGPPQSSQKGKKQVNITQTQLLLPLLSSCSCRRNKVVGTMHPAHPGDPEEETSKNQTRAEA